MNIKRLAVNIATVDELISVGPLSLIDKMVIAYRLELLNLDEFRDFVFLYRLDLELLR